MKNKTTIIVSTTIFLIIFLFFFKGLQNTNVYTPEVNKFFFPSFEAKIFESKNKINSNEIFDKKKFYLFNIWASWCGPCRTEHSLLMNLKNQKNIEVIGLNYKDDNKKAKNFLEELGNPYETILSDEDGTIAIEWGAYGVPESFLIYENKIIKKIKGPINNNSLLEIKELIK
tara:strand:- start:979 stop:1494 length:516 start_codon:yes stop_codon:yes gene_type:complete